MTSRQRRLAARAFSTVLLIAALLALPASASALGTLKPGSRGPSVKRLQSALKLPADGIYGARTRAVVKRFQRRHRLTADGLVGPATWRALKISGPTRRKTSSGSSKGSAVKALQRRLRIGADGVFGAGTSAAVKRFQRRRGLTADGVVGRATWRALGFSDNRPVLKRGGSLRGNSGNDNSGSGSVPARIARAIRAANQIARKPYRYGGGHGTFRDTGYDCSGSISYVLNGGGMINTQLTSGGFMNWGSAGPGRWITIYANPGHAYMRIKTASGWRTYDTSGMDDGTRWDRRVRPTSGYAVRHPTGF